MAYDGLKFASVQTYELESYGGFKPGDKVSLFGIPVFVVSFTNIPGGVSVRVQRVFREAYGVNEWTDSACNLRKLPEPTDEDLNVSSAAP